MSHGGLQRDLQLNILLLLLVSIVRRTDLLRQRVLRLMLVLRLQLLRVPVPVVRRSGKLLPACGEKGSGGQCHVRALSVLGLSCACFHVSRDETVQGAKFTGGKFQSIELITNSTYGMPHTGIQVVYLCICR